MLIEVAILVYPGFELLDASGPASVFGTANFVLVQRQKSCLRDFGGVVDGRCGAQQQRRQCGYETAVKGSSPKAAHLPCCGGGRRPLREVLKDPIVRERAPRWAEKSNRYGSICAGTFVLAELQLIDGRRVASHWSACRPLAAAYPKVEVDENAIFVQDGNVWTSAGVSTGIDMALAMVANDTCKAIANDVAKRLVLYVRRPGNQSQFSPLLRAQRTAEHPFGDMMDWVHLNLEQKLDVPTLAARRVSANVASSENSPR